MRVDGTEQCDWSSGLGSERGLMADAASPMLNMPSKSFSPAAPTPPQIMAPLHTRPSKHRPVLCQEHLGANGRPQRSLQRKASSDEADGHASLFLDRSHTRPEPCLANLPEFL